MGLFDDTQEELFKHLCCDNTFWLFGAGISAEANIPLMRGLTDLIEKKLASNPDVNKIYNMLISDMPSTYHIEHALSQIVDFLAIAERTTTKSIEIKGLSVTESSLKILYDEIISHIGDIVKYGYMPEDPVAGTSERYGTISSPLVDIKNHRDFVKAMIDNKSNMFSRSSIYVFTSNYDTLIEDAFALEHISVSDGFTGTAIGYWDPSFNDTSHVNVVKLHGSVDWVKHPTDGLFRIRYGVKYPSSASIVLIYPQATKYIETQRDPFAYLFQTMRLNLQSETEHALVSIGYSFEDNHLNYEIESALTAPNNKTTLLIFIPSLNGLLTKWLSNSDINKRVYIATKDGLYNGSLSLIPCPGRTCLNWWKFSAFIKYFKDGILI